ncbi:MULTISPECIES: MFS transporter [Streptomyces]|uniref:MFS transporter n=1 Tax=Streptomyces TaxID=1883 RepID=UPI000A448E68|nr:MULTISPECIES: MFS transporter [Streptomyces]MDH6226004.1 MFS family permease [Streptomyces sp. MJP52]
MTQQTAVRHPGAPLRAPRHMRSALFLDHLFGSLGLFTVFPVLGLLLAARTPGTGSGWVGAGLFCYTASAGLSALVLNRWLHRVGYRTGMVGGVLLSAVAFGSLPYPSAPWALCALLILAGTGVSVHYTVSRVLIAEAVSDDIGRHKIFSLFQIAVNAGAMLGPFIANALYREGDPRLLMAVIALCYLLAGGVLTPGVPRGHRPPATSGSWPLSRSMLREVVRTSAVWRLVVVGTVGTFAYAQFYSAFALYVGRDFDSGAMRSALLAVPALSIVLLQTLVTAGVGRLMAAGRTPLNLLGHANLLFAAAMLLLGSWLPAAVGAVLAVVVFALAEMVWAPMMSTAFASLRTGSSLEVMHLRQVCRTTGDALGSLAGGSLFLLLHDAGRGGLYWAALGLLTLAATVPLAFRDRGPARPGPRD